MTSMGRMAAHTGQIVTFDEMLNCEHEFAPDVDKLTMDVAGAAPARRAAVVTPSRSRGSRRTGSSEPVLPPRADPAGGPPRSSASVRETGLFPVRGGSLR